jgi:hypothetical protein
MIWQFIPGTTAGFPLQACSGGLLLPQFPLEKAQETRQYRGKIISTAFEEPFK